MADVQLEGGFVRLANSLNRALIVARFTPVQTRIVQLLIQQTYGWQRKTVEISVSEIAAFLDVPVSGGFRRALADLIDAGVVLMVLAGTGRTRSVFAVEKDHERWGKYAISAAFLAARFGKRPTHRDTLLTLGDAREPDLAVESPPGESQNSEEHDESTEGAPTQAPSPISEGDPTEASTNEYDPTEAPREPAQGELLRPHRGTLTGSNSLFGETYEAGKTGKTVELTTTTTTARGNANATDEKPSPYPAVNLSKLLRWTELAELFGTEHNRAHAIAFLEQQHPDGRNAWSGRLANWLQGLDCPPSLQPSPDQLATALSEYAGDASWRHVWAFVEDMVRRYQRANGGGLPRFRMPSRASPEDLIKRRAVVLWELVKSEGLASCNPMLIADRVKALAADKKLPADLADPAEFLSVFSRLPRNTLANAKQDFYAIQAIIEALSAA